MKVISVSVKATLFGLFCIGLISVVLLVVYLISCGVCILFDVYPGAIAFTPKWIFIFGILVLLGNIKLVKQTLKRIADYIDKKSSSG